MKFGVYANSSAEVGEGHCIRCLNLVRELHTDEIVWFYTSMTERVESLVNQLKNIHLIKLNSVSELGRLSEQKSVDVIIIDDYHIPLAQRLTNSSYIVVFDDLADRNIHSDILIDANPLRTLKDYEGKVNARCELLINETYMMLKAEYFSGDISKKEKTGHIFFGATDPLVYSYEVSRYLCDHYPDWRWHLVVTQLTPDVQACLNLAQLYNNIHVEYEPESLVEGLLLSEIAIGAPGTTTWERLAAGCHSGLIASNKNQIAILNSLDDEGYIHFIQGNSLAEHLQGVDSFIQQSDKPYRALNFSANAAQVIMNEILQKAKGKKLGLLS
jgi:spore coat polysaccharide biosynthesis predicted glycosyltransferase SpsG